MEKWWSWHTRPPRWGAIARLEHGLLFCRVLPVVRTSEYRPRVGIEGSATMMNAQKQGLRVTL